MTKDEFFAQMKKVAEHPEAKKAMEEAKTAAEMIQAAALAGVTISEKDLQEMAEACRKSGEELGDLELDMVTAAGSGVWDWIKTKILQPLVKPNIFPIDIDPDNYPSAPPVIAPLKPVVVNPVINPDIKPNDGNLFVKG